MTPSNARSFLLGLVHSRVEEKRHPSQWEFSLTDEVLLFTFIHPSVNTRDPAFRLFNLPVTWNTPESAIVDESGGKTIFSLTRCLAGDELHRATASEKFDDGWI